MEPVKEQQKILGPLSEVRESSIAFNLELPEGRAERTSGKWQQQ
jgi:hypothetical protein